MAKKQKAVAIIGGGPAGLSVARALQVLGISYVIFEKHRDVGGIWDLTNAGSPMYESAHFISSKTTSGNVGFPMPDHFPDYPSNKQILHHIRAYAEHLGVYDHIELKTKVLSVEKKGDIWQLTVEKNGKKRKEEFAYVVCANGTNWVANQPKLKGEASFSGEIIHSVDYHKSDSLKGQRVLVVGAGNSAVDIACDAAFAAKEAYISMRRGYYFVPKHIFGEPADVFGARSDWLPIKFQQFSLGIVLRMLTGDLTRLGLKKPDHPPLASHPILNTQILHYMQHGDLIAKPDIDRVSGDEVIFEDGSRVTVDKIVMATGYHWQLPFLGQKYFDWKNNRPRSFLTAFNPKEPSLFLNGFVETNSSAYKLFDELGFLIAKAIEAQMQGGKSAAAFKAYISRKRPELGGSIKYVESARHTNYANKTTLRRAMKIMRRQLGWPTAEKTYREEARG